MPRITPGKLYNVPNAGAFRRGGPLATDHWEVLDREKTTVVARGPKPVRALRDLGVPITITVPEPNTWRELLLMLDEAAESVELRGARFAHAAHVAQLARVRLGEALYPADRVEDGACRCLVEPRRDFIQDNALNVANLDV